MAYRSKFESTVITKLKRNKVKFFYEKERLSFIQPAIKRSYLPDLFFPQTNIFVELKGQFRLQDRKKHIWLKESTDYDIRFCFQNARDRISKQSKTTYAMWCDKNNIQWCEKEIPKEWMVKNDRLRKE